jgi:hypothetical protein
MLIAWVGLIAWVWGLAGCTVFVQEEARQVGAFDQVANLSRVDVEVIVGGDEEVVGVLCADDQIERLVTEVINGELQIGTEHRFGDVWSECEVTVNVPFLRGIRGAGEGDTALSGDLSSLVRVEGAGSGELDVRGDLSDLELVVASGTGEVEVDGISAVSTRLELSGAGPMQVTGSSNLVEIESSGSGDLDATELRVYFADIVSRGSGDVSLYASEEVTVTLTGTGDVWLSGQPDVDVSDSGTGDVIVR